MNYSATPKRAFIGFLQALYYIGVMAKSKNPLPILDCYNDLAGSYNHAWQMLVNGARDRRSPFHTPAMATSGLSGTPELRTVVLRDASASEKWLRFNTDNRSLKIKEILTNNKGAMHFYDADAKIQLRVACSYRLASEQELDALWSKTPDMSRECYQVTTAPGATVEGPLDVSFDAETSMDGKPHFQPVFAQIKTIEWLYLAAAGHRRARFDLQTENHDASPTHMTWLVP